LDGVVAAFSIAGRAVGPFGRGGSEPCFIIAEAGVNHNGERDTALALIDAAANAGADAVKFQTFSADRLVTPEAPKAAYQKASGRADESQLAMLKRLELDEEAHRALMRRCREKNIVFLSSPFDEQSADLLEALGVEAFKVPSGELTNHAFLGNLAARGLPLIVSTGMATMTEVADAAAVIRHGGNPPLALLHCVSAYPADPGDSNLKAMASMADAIGVPVGWSDHTPGIEVAIAAAALGAAIVEKHLTLDCAMAGPDHAASLEPDQMAAMIAAIRRIEGALGDGNKAPGPREAEIAAVARKSLTLVRDMAAGETLSADDVVAKRPGTGIAPSELAAYTGRRLLHGADAGALLTPDMFAGGEGGGT